MYFRSFLRRFFTFLWFGVRLTIHRLLPPTVWYVGSIVGVVLKKPMTFKFSLESILFPEYSPYRLTKFGCGGLIIADWPDQRSTYRLVNYGWVCEVISWRRCSLFEWPSLRPAIQVMCGATIFGHNKQNYLVYSACWEVAIVWYIKDR